MVIAVRQWPHLVNMPVHSSGFFALVAELLRGYGAWELPSLLCGLVALAGLFALERVPRLPAALIVILASIAAAGYLAAHGVVLTGPIHLALAAS